MENRRTHYVTRGCWTRFLQTNTKWESTLKNNLKAGGRICILCTQGSSFQLFSSSVSIVLWSLVLQQTSSHLLHELHLAFKVCRINFPSTVSLLFLKQNFKSSENHHYKVMSPNIFTTALWRHIQVCAAFPVAAAAICMFITSAAVTVVKRHQHTWTLIKYKHITTLHFILNTDDHAGVKLKVTSPVIC